MMVFLLLLVEGLVWGLAQGSFDLEIKAWRLTKGLRSELGKSWYFHHDSGIHLQLGAQEFRLAAAVRVGLLRD
jgi:hypothetical protein